MNEHRYAKGLIAVLLLGSGIAIAQEKKPAAVPAKPPAKPAAAPSKSAPAGGASKGAGPSTAAHGPTTAGGAAHGPTTAGGAAHGPTTAGAAAKGPTTAGGAAKGPSTAGRGGTTNAGAHPGSPAGGGAHPATAGGGRPGSVASNNRGPGGNAGHAGPAGSHTVRASNGSTIRTRSNGSRADVHDAKRGMDIHHGLNGNRRVSVERADHSRVVTERGGRRGYVQRPYSYRGHEYAHRTYYANGRAYDRFYRGYSYRGVYIAGYAPAYYYAPAFYGWAYNPWVRPVPYAWGWGGNPWYGYYGGYFAPYPVYPSASLWLTDYIISQSLAANYAAQQAAAQQQPMAPDAAPLTPQIKDMIADEVKRQIALTNQEAQTTSAGGEVDPASSGIARMMSDNIQHVFVAGSDLDVIDAGGMECAVSEGDALQLTGPPPANATAADLLVLSSKGGQECHKGATVSIAMADLQDMQNHMRETIDQGMADLQAKGGQGGLPAVPQSAQAAPVKTPFAAIAPPPDPNAATEISQQAAEADKAEQEVASQVPQDGGPSAASPAPAAPAAAPVVGIGQTVEQVTAILGQPQTILDRGNTKKTYVYKDMKVLFTGGKVVDIQ